MPKYTVTITREELVERKKKDWLPVEFNAEGKVQKYDYVEAVLPTTESVTLYEQALPELDLVAVIRAVNGITQLA